MKKKKKNTPSTFVLNVNDISYFFVEGTKKKSTGPFYCVYYEDSKEEPVKFSATNFVEIHGLHEKESLAKFTKKALLKLTALRGMDNRVNKIYQIFYNVHYNTINGDIKNPKLSKASKREFIDALYEYNEIKDLVAVKPDISYDEDYELVKEKEAVKQVKRYVPDTERKVVKKIVNEYGMTKGVQRKLKYD